MHAFSPGPLTIGCLLVVAIAQRLHVLVPTGREAETSRAVRACESAGCDLGCKQALLLDRVSTAAQVGTTSCVALTPPQHHAD